MILKTADDKSRQIAQIEQCLAEPKLNTQQKQWLTDELLRLRTGIQGGRDAAFNLDSHLKDSANHVLIRDLRMEVDGDVAQTDHSVFYRAAVFTCLKPITTTAACSSMTMASSPPNTGGCALVSHHQLSKAAATSGCCTNCSTGWKLGADP